MRIGELARASGTTSRMLRYYEAEGLLSAERAPNGYRRYRQSDVDRAITVAALVRAGLPTRLIRIVLRAEESSDGWTTACDAEFAAILRAEVEALDERISCLRRSRSAVADYLERAANTSPDYSV